MSFQDVQLPASSFALAACPVVWFFSRPFPPFHEGATFFGHSCIIFAVCSLQFYIYYIYCITAFLVISTQVVRALSGVIRIPSIARYPSHIFPVTRCGQPRRFHLGRLQSWSGLSPDAPPSCEIHCRNFCWVFIF